MASSFATRRTHEARQARVSLARLDLCSREHYSDAGGVSSLPRGFLLKYQNASITKPTTRAILKTRKMRGSKKAPASFQRRTPTKPTAASCRTGFTITGLGSREWRPYGGRARKVSPKHDEIRCVPVDRRRSGEELRGLGARRWWRSHARQRPAGVRPARAHPFGEPERQRARALERLFADRRLLAGEHFARERLHGRHVVARRRRPAERARNTGVGDEHSFVADQDVLRFQFTVCDFGGVRVREPVH